MPSLRHFHRHNHRELNRQGDEVYRTCSDAFTRGDTASKRIAKLQPGTHATRKAQAEDDERKKDAFGFHDERALFIYARQNMRQALGKASFKPSIR